jgi:hypothetical protein
MHGRAEAKFEEISETKKELERLNSIIKKFKDS